MKTNLSAIALLVLATAFVIGGCSQDLSTSPDISANIDQQFSDVREVLVVYRGERPYAAVQAAGGIINREYQYFPILAVTVPANAINALRNNPNIKAVEEDIPRELCAQTLVWGVDRIDAEYVHAKSGNRGAGVNVAVLDTGGDMDHPDILWASGYSVIGTKTDAWDDMNGHGTHCAGIVGAKDNDMGVVGVAPECNLHMIQVSRGRRLPLFNIVAGFDRCVATHHDDDPNNDIQIVSMSFSGSFSVAEETAAQSAYDEGILMVAASGNASGAVGYPAALPTVMAVSGSNSLDDMYLPSNTGPEIELIAPGQSIYSTYKSGTYTTMSGTSMACPHVAGVAALVWSANPEFTRDQVRIRLQETAEVLDLTLYQQGHGLVDAENATLGTTDGNNLPD